MEIAILPIPQTLAGMDIALMMCYILLFGCAKGILSHAAIAAILMKEMRMTRGVRNGIHVIDVQSGVLLTTGLCDSVPGPQVFLRVTPTRLSHVRNVTV